MTEASFYYQTASSGLGQEFLDDLQRTIEAVRERSKLGRVFVFRLPPVAHV